MSTINTGKARNKIKELESLSNELYENIFKVTLVKNNDKSFYFYNILNKAVFPDTIDKNAYDIKILNIDTPWTTFSYQLYSTINLWWILFLLNKPDYIFLAKAGQQYKYIKPNLVQSVLDKLVNE
jgi:hypothetical protein